MSTMIVDGQIITTSSEVQTVLAQAALVKLTRDIPSQAFLALWLPAEVAGCSAADPRLFYAMMRAMTQGIVNLDSPDLQPLLDLAISKGVLTPDRAAKIRAGLPPV